MKITFITSTQDHIKLKLVSNICTLISKYIKLPDHIEVEFKKMGMSSYGETIVDPRRVIKRIVLNSDLTAKELFYPTIHELVHVSQMYVGKLSMSRTGVYIWENKTYPVDPLKMSYKDYQQLPWEVDAHRQQMILSDKLLEDQ